MARLIFEIESNMQTLLASVSTSMQASDHSIALSSREQDVLYRQILEDRFHMSEARRQVDEKSQQLKCIAHLSALIGGFSTVMLVEVSIVSTQPPGVVAAFATSASIVVRTFDRQLSWIDHLVLDWINDNCNHKLYLYAGCNSQIRLYKAWCVISRVLEEAMRR